MNATTMFGLCGAALVGIGLFGLITNAELPRKILALNILATGIFLLFGAIAKKRSGCGNWGRSRPPSNGDHRNRRRLRRHCHGRGVGAPALRGSRSSDA